MCKNNSGFFTASILIKFEAFCSSKRSKLPKNRNLTNKPNPNNQTTVQTLKISYRPQYLSE